jgi:hypothetical protein
MDESFTVTMQPLDVDEDETPVVVRRGGRLYPETEIGCVLVAGFAIVMMGAAAVFFVWVGTYVKTTGTAPSLSATIISGAAQPSLGLLPLVLALLSFLRLLV